ncbi:MAG: hypothetical protein ACTS6G_00510 [Candidatus Hodgkinia cicadicola]
MKKVKNVGRDVEFLNMYQLSKRKLIVRRNNETMLRLCKVGLNKVKLFRN